MTKDELRSEISDLEDKIEELEDLLSDTPNFLDFSRACSFVK